MRPPTLPSPLRASSGVAASARPHALARERLAEPGDQCGESFPRSLGLLKYNLERNSVYDITGRPSVGHGGTVGRPATTSVETVPQRVFAGGLENPPHGDGSPHSPQSNSLGGEIRPVRHNTGCSLIA